MPEWNALPRAEKYARMARQGHGFITSLPVRIVKPDQPNGALVDVAKNGSLGKTKISAKRLQSLV